MLRLSARYGFAAWLCTGLAIDDLRVGRPELALCCIAVGMIVHLGYASQARPA